MPSQHIAAPFVVIWNVRTSCCSRGSHAAARRLKLREWRGGSLIRSNCIWGAASAHARLARKTRTWRLTYFLRSLMDGLATGPFCHRELPRYGGGVGTSLSTTTSTTRVLFSDGSVWRRAVQGPTKSVSKNGGKLCVCAAHRLHQEKCTFWLPHITTLTPQVRHQQHWLHWICKSPMDSWF